MKNNICNYKDDEYNTTDVNPDLSYKDIDNYINQLYVKYANILIYMLKYHKSQTLNLKIKIAEFVFILNKLDAIMQYYYIGANPKMTEELNIRVNICHYLKFLIKNYEVFQRSNENIPNFVDTSWDKYKSLVIPCICNIEDNDIEQPTYADENNPIDIVSSAFEDKIDTRNSVPTTIINDELTSINHTNENIELFMLNLIYNSANLTRLNKSTLLNIFNYNYDYLFNKFKSKSTQVEDLEFKFFRTKFIALIVFKLVRKMENSEIEIINIFDKLQLIYDSREEFIRDIRHHLELINNFSISKYISSFSHIGGNKLTKSILNKSSKKKGSKIKGSKKKSSKRKGSKK